MFRKSVFVVCVLGLFVSGVAIASAADLSGKWNCDDGRQYYLRQVGNTLYWYGERSATNPAWSTSFRGTSMGSESTATGWTCPRDRHSSQGVLQMQIKDDGNVLEATRKTGGFGGSRWVRVRYVPARRVYLLFVRIASVLTNAEVKKIGARWKIVDGNGAMFDFRNAENEARIALRIIKHYRMNSPASSGVRIPRSATCLSEDMLVRHFGGEDCVQFNPNTIEVKKVGGRWRSSTEATGFMTSGTRTRRVWLSPLSKVWIHEVVLCGKAESKLQYLRK